MTAPLKRPHPRASRDPSPTAWERGEEPWRALANGLIVGLRAAATDELAAAWAALGVRASAPAGDIDADVVHGALRDTRHQALVQLTTQLQRAGQLRSDVSTDLAAELVGHLFGQGLLSTLARRAGVAPDDYAALPRAVAALDDDVIAAVVDDVVRVAGDGLAPPCSPRG